MLKKVSGFSFLGDASVFPPLILGRDVLGVLWLLMRGSITPFHRASAHGFCPSHCSCDGCRMLRWHFMGPPSVGDGKWRHRQVKLHVSVELSSLCIPAPWPVPLRSHCLRPPARLSLLAVTSLKEQPFLLNSQRGKLPAGLNGDYFLSFPEYFSFSKSCLPHSSLRLFGKSEGLDIRLWVEQ